MGIYSIFSNSGHIVPEGLGVWLGYLIPDLAGRDDSNDIFFIVEF